MRPIVLKVIKYSKSGIPLGMSKHLCHECPVRYSLLSEKRYNFDKEYKKIYCDEYKNCMIYCFENKIK